MNQCVLKSEPAFALGQNQKNEMRRLYEGTLDIVNAYLVMHIRASWQ